MRAEEGNGIKPAAVWTGETAITGVVEDGCKLLGNFPCSNVYRSSLIDSWTELDIKEVLYTSLYHTIY